MKARDNPFRSECIERLAYRGEDFSWELFEQRLTELGNRGALAGPEGHGKTTLLEQWGRRLAANGESVVFLRFDWKQRKLREEQRQRLEASAGAWLLADSVDQLDGRSFREFGRLAEKARGIVVTTHQPGLWPVLRECRTSPEMLMELIVELGAEAADGAALWRRHAGNFRLVFRELYDRYAVREEAFAPVG
jgi:hypothetical protein